MEVVDEEAVVAAIVGSVVEEGIAAVVVAVAMICPAATTTPQPGGETRGVAAGIFAVGRGEILAEGVEVVTSEALVIVEGVVVGGVVEEVVPLRCFGMYFGPSAQSIINQRLILECLARLFHVDDDELSSFIILLGIPFMLYSTYVRT